MRKILLFILLLSSFSLTAQMQMRLRGSHNPVLTPQQVDSLFYWFDAANLSSLQDSVGGAIANNEGVATWYDMSGRGWHVTQTTNTDRPVYKATGGPGSKPCIQFDGSDDFLESSSHWWGSDDFTIIIVMKFANATRNAEEIYIAKTTANYSILQFNVRASADLPPVTPTRDYAHHIYLFKDGGGTNYNYVYDGAKSSSFQVCIWINTLAPATTFYLDGSSQTTTLGTSGTGNRTITDASTPVYIGGAGNPMSSPLQGSISEIIVYSKDLTADERVGIEEYLQAKWGL